MTLFFLMKRKAVSKTEVDCCKRTEHYNILPYIYIYTYIYLYIYTQTHKYIYQTFLFLFLILMSKDDWMPTHGLLELLD